jgi:hypothetical protein
VRSSQNHLLSYSKCYYTGRLELTMYSSNYYKVNMCMYASLYATRLKIFTSDFFNISELKKKTMIYENLVYRVLQYSLFSNGRLINSFHSYKNDFYTTLQTDRHICFFLGHNLRKCMIDVMHSDTF